MLDLSVPEHVSPLLSLWFGRQFFVGVFLFQVLVLLEGHIGRPDAVKRAIDRAPTMAPLRHAAITAGEERLSL